ncbi:S8 family serine peptidase [Streptomyces sp. NBC_01450]|uniref:S8 family serine peptidase n=1 Tax=Streptomyces sp. NBC_01450 TaxID=2903871 RepID=UPI002E30314B|nr:S8 family serine peptidase [Streptomyces sp. NBC_01450]
MLSTPSGRPWAAALGAVLLATAGLTPAVAHAAPVADTPAHPARAVQAAPTLPGSHTVTLITGDVVTVGRTGSAGGSIQVRQADGAPSTARIEERNGHLYVLPRAADHYLATNRLDRRLFDVTQLIADGFDDQHRPQLPLIVSYTDAAVRSRTTGVPEGAAKSRVLDAVQGAALTESRSHAADFWASVTAVPSGSRTDRPTGGFRQGIGHIWLDGRVHAQLADSTAQIGAPEVWKGGNTGKGVDVAVLDTGIDTGHPDLVGKTVASQDFTGGDDVTDRNGHGTHVASTIAGTGAASDGRERGVAPDAGLIVGKVLDKSGAGAESGIVAAMEWAVRDQHAKIVSMSLGSGPTEGNDPMSQAVNALSAETGALFVIAAGNSGPAEGTVSAPGTADAALTVGAVDAHDKVADFSSRGPRLGDRALKPEITAPGVDISAARSQYIDAGSGYYQTLSGTSMATPHVAGAAALLAAQHPSWTGRQLKDALVSTVKPTPGATASEGGNGRVDIAAATRASVVATGTAYVPVDDAAPAGGVRREVTWSNSAATPVTLHLGIDAGSAPAGLFSLDRTDVTVPAGGTASATLTVDTSRTTSTTHTGQITATASDGTTATRTLIGVGRIVHYHLLTISVKDRDGSPMPYSQFQLSSGDTDYPPTYEADENGTRTLRVPEGVYSTLSYLETTGSHGPNSLGMALVGSPEVNVDHDMSVVLDISRTREVKALTPKPSVPVYARTEYYRSLGTNSWRIAQDLGEVYDTLWAEPVPKNVQEGDFWFTARARMTQPWLTLSSDGTTYDDLTRQINTARLPEGTSDLPVVFAGDGLAADYRDLKAKGRIVLVRRSLDQWTRSAQVEAAAKAGAKLLLVVNQYGGRGVDRYFDSVGNNAGVEVALMGKDEGEQLIQQVQAHHVTLRMESHPFPDYLYDLENTQHGSLPADSLVQRPRTRDLARVDTRFRSTAVDTTAGEYRFDAVPYSDWNLGAMLPSAPQGDRTDWVTPGGPERWTQQAFVDGQQMQYGPYRQYQRGSTQTDEWFGPLQRPRLTDGYPLPRRAGSTFRIEVPSWGGTDHTGLNLQSPNLQQATTTLWQGDTRLAQEDSTTRIEVEAPSAATLPYRLTVDAHQDASVSPYASKTSTEWGFRSAASQSADEAEPLPLVQLDYAVGLDDGGRARRIADLTVTSSFPGGVTTGGRIGRPTLQLSYDEGATWHTARLTADGHGGWRTSLQAPAHARTVSLRASADDSAGDSVRQTVMRAFGLR